MGVDWWTPKGVLADAIFDELYLFMTMRVHVPGARSVVRVDRWSLPLARWMIQRIETCVMPDGRTRLRYRIGFDAPWIFRMFVPPLRWLFRKWFAVSLKRLARVVESRQA